MVIRLCEGRFGITRREWRVIALLAHDGEQLSSQLAERAQLDRARTSRAITSLVAKKLVRRLPGQADRRQARLALTPAGTRAATTSMFPLVARSTAGLVSVLDEGAGAQLDNALDRLQQQADRMVAQAELPQGRSAPRRPRAQRLG
jgi:DNA-binding MarR family transcriptional regulator